MSETVGRLTSFLDSTSYVTYNGQSLVIPPKGNITNVVLSLLGPLPSGVYFQAYGTTSVVPSSRVAGSNGHIQFNSSGILGAEDALYWNSVTDHLRIGGEQGDPASESLHLYGAMIVGQAENEVDGTFEYRSSVFRFRQNGAWVTLGSGGGIGGADPNGTETILGDWTFSTHPLGLDHTQIANSGTYTHTQIDTHLSDSTTHFTKASITIGDLSNVSSSTPEDGNALVWSASSSSWIPSETVGYWTRTSTTVHYTGRVKIGGAGIATRGLEIHGESTNAASSVFNCYSDTTAYANLYLQRSRGSYSELDPIVGGDSIGGVYYNAYHGSTYRTAAAVRAKVGVLGSYPGGTLQLQTSSSSSDVLTTAISVFNNQHVRIGSTDSIPTEFLQVDGAVTVGAATGTVAGTVQWASSHLSVYSGSAWIKLDSWGTSGNDIFFDNSSGGIILGAPTATGSWRVIINSTNLVFQRYESGAWVTKGTARQTYATSSIDDTDSPYAISSSEHAVICDTSSGGIVVTLPTVSEVEDQKFIVKKSTTDLNTITISGAVDGLSSILIANPRESVTILSDGTYYYRV